MIRWYERLITVYGGKFEPMLELAKTMASTPFGKTLFVLGSHEDLGFSTVGTYPETNQRPSVWVRYSPADGTFRVKYRRCLHGPREVQICQPSDVKQVLESMLIGLIAMPKTDTVTDAATDDPVADLPGREAR